MPPTDRSPDEGGNRILIEIDALMRGDDLEVWPVDGSATTLDRLSWVGDPVILAGASVAGRRLPVDPDARIAWVRLALDRPDAAVAPIEEPTAGQSREAAERRALNGWLAVRRAWQADRLLTVHDASVRPARRAGLTVVRIGPGDGGRTSAVERPDHEARDLRDAVSQLLATDVFDGPAR